MPLSVGALMNLLPTICDYIITERGYTFTREDHHALVNLSLMRKELHEEPLRHLWRERVAWTLVPFALLLYNSCTVETQKNGPDDNAVRWHYITMTGKITDHDLDRIRYYAKFVTQFDPRQATHRLCMEGESFYEALFRPFIQKKEPFFPNLRSVNISTKAQAASMELSREHIDIFTTETLEKLKLEWDVGIMSFSRRDIFRPQWQSTLRELDIDVLAEEADWHAIVQLFMLEVLAIRALDLDPGDDDQSKLRHLKTIKIMSRHDHSVRRVFAALQSPSDVQVINIRLSPDVISGTSSDDGNASNQVQDCGDLFSLCAQRCAQSSGLQEFSFIVTESFGATGTLTVQHIKLLRPFKTLRRLCIDTPTIAHAIPDEDILSLSANLTHLSKLTLIGRASKLTLRVLPGLATELPYLVELKLAFAQVNPDALPPTVAASFPTDHHMFFSIAAYSSPIERNQRKKVIDFLHKVMPCATTMLIEEDEDLNRYVYHWRYVVQECYYLNAKNVEAALG